VRKRSPTLRRRCSTRNLCRALFEYLALWVSSRCHVRSVTTTFVLDIQDCPNRMLRVSGVGQHLYCEHHQHVISQHPVSISKQQYIVRLLYHNGLSGPQGRFSWEAVYSPFLSISGCDIFLLLDASSLLFGSAYFFFFFQTLTFMLLLLPCHGVRTRIWVSERWDMTSWMRNWDGDRGSFVLLPNTLSNCDS
jgi:hypothetical protein